MPETLPVETPTTAPTTTTDTAPTVPSTVPAERPAPPHPFDDPDVVRQRKEAFKQARKPSRNDRATPADVPQIQELTRLIKTLTPSNDADAPRIKDLKAKLKSALELDSPAPATEPVAPKLPTRPAEFTDAEPKLEDFTGKSDDPYAAYMRALSAYDRKKEAHDSQLSDADKAYQAAEAKRAEWFQGIEAAYATRIDAAKKKYPDWDRVTGDKQATTVLNDTLKFMPNGAEATYWLGQHPDVLDELNLLSFNLPRTDPSVALLQRRLTARMATETTGAAPPREIKLAPRPFTPVGTAAMTPVDDAAQDDDSLDAHDARYGRSDQRRRR